MYELVEKADLTDPGTAGGDLAGGG